MTEIAMIDAISFSFMLEKSTLPIQTGLSGLPSRSSLEQKFS